MKTLVEEIQQYRDVLTEDSDEFTPRSYEEHGHLSHQSTLSPWVYEQTFHFDSESSGNKYPNTHRAKYSNHGNKEEGTSEMIVTVYDRLNNSVEVIHMGQNHLPVYFDFDSPEKAQRYLDKFNIELKTGSGYIN